jgi:NitT/TauT family transport system substrate-binding protein
VPAAGAGAPTPASSQGERGPAAAPSAARDGAAGAPAGAAGGPAGAGTGPAGTPSAAGGAAPALATVHVGIVGATTEVGQYLALDRGYFQEAGLQPDFIQFDSTPLMTAPLSTGDLDVGSGAIAAGLFNAIERGVDLRIVGPQARYEPGHSAVSLLVAKDLADSGAIRDWPDLRGRKMAIPSRNSSTEFALDAALRRAGLALTDVDLSELGMADITVALANRGVDAALQIEPQATIAAEQGIAVRREGPGDWLPGIQYTVVLYGPGFAQRNADAGRRWMVAYLRGLRDFNDAWVKGRGSRDEVVATVTRHTALKDPALITKIGWPMLDPNGQINTDSIRDQIRWYVERGVMPTETDLSKAVDMQYVQYALGVLGPYE